MQDSMTSGLSGISGLSGRSGDSSGDPGETPPESEKSEEPDTKKADSAALIAGLIGAIQSYAEDALCADQLVSRASARDPSRSSSQDFTRDFDLDAKFGSLFQGLADAVRTTGHWHGALFAPRSEGGLFPIRLYDAEGHFQFSQLCQMVGGQPKAFQTPHLRALLEELQSAKLYFKSHARAPRPQQNDPETLRREGARLMALSLRQRLRHHHEPPFEANEASRRQVLDLLD